MGWWFFHEDYATQKDFVQEKVLPHEFGDALHNSTLTIEHVSQRSGEVYPQHSGGMGIPVLCFGMRAVCLSLPRENFAVV